MTNDRFEDFLKSAVHDLDPVPEVPREEMWARIDQARRFRRAAQAPTSVRPPRPAKPVRPPRPVWQRFGAWAVAAAALLAVGFGIGRFSGIARDPVASPLATRESEAGIGTTADRTVAAAPAGLAAENGDYPSRPRIDQASRPGVDRAEPPPADPTRPVGDAVDGPYRLAALWHLSRAEGLLTSVAVGEVDAQLTGWASQMLTTTRLMLDSPAADDPRMARLLEDLELILVQIASTTEDRKDADLQWIQQGLETNNVLPRLRAALPADRALMGT